MENIPAKTGTANLLQMYRKFIGIFRGCMKTLYIALILLLTCAKSLNCIQYQHIMIRRCEEKFSCSTSFAAENLSHN